MPEVIDNSVAKWAFSLATHGIFTRGGLATVIEKYLDLHLISQYVPGILTAACMQFPVPKINYFQLNASGPERIKSILLASSAIPLVYNPEQIDGRFYVDGGILDNCPVLPVYNLGCQVIFVVHLSSSASVNRAQYPRAQICEIIPSRPLGSFIQGTLDFSSVGIKNRMELGFQDGMKMGALVHDFVTNHSKVQRYLQIIKENFL